MSKERVNEFSVGASPECIHTHTHTHRVFVCYFIVYYIHFHLVIYKLYIQECIIANIIKCTQK